MALRFKQPSSTSTPLNSPTCSILGSTKALFVWPVAKDRLYYYVTGDAQTNYVDRTATTGTSFNATEGTIETSNATPDSLFTLPNDLLGTDWVNQGPFTVIYLMNGNTSGGGQSGGTVNVFSAINGSGYGTMLAVSSSGGWQVKTYNASPSFTHEGPGIYPLDSQDHFMVYRFTNGDQDYWLNSTALSSGSVATSGTTVLGNSTYPLKIGSTFYNGSSSRQHFFKGCIIVPSALSDTQISNIVGVSGLIVDEGGGSSLKPRLSLLGAG